MTEEQRCLIDILKKCASYKEANLKLNEKSCQDIVDYIDKLENNWNELKDWLGENKYFYSGLQGED